MKSSRSGHSSAAKNTSMEHGSDVLAKNGSLLPEKRTISLAEVAWKGIKQYRVRELTLLILGILHKVGVAKTGTRFVGV